MVKVQKPTPKSFSKIGNMDKIKKKKSEGAGRIKKDAAIDTVKKTEKKILLEKTVKEEKLIAPIKKDKAKLKLEKSSKKENNLVATLPATKKIKQKKDVQLEKKKATKPLVLAPPESPKPTVPIPNANDKSKKAKKNAEKATPATTTTLPSKQKKTQKKSKQSANKQPPLTKMQQKKKSKRAFKKQQLKAKIEGKVKKEKKPIPHNFDPVPFDEEKFKSIVTTANIKKIAKALKAEVEEEVAKKKTSIFSDYRYMLNVSSFKIPNCPKRMVKLSLKHSLVDKDDDVVIIVTDVQRGAKADYETTIQHYEDLFREAGIENLKIMPFNQLRKEFKTFETVRKFSNTYDYFLCDGRIVGHVNGFCGKIFQKPRTTFHAVRVETAKNLKLEIDRALRRTAYKQLNKGDMISIPVGNHKYTMTQLAENVEYVIDQLKELYPGGYPNIRNMNLKIDITGTSSLPIYVSMGEVPPETPNVIGPREQRMLGMKKKVNDILTKFNLNKYGEMTKLNKTQEERKRKLKESLIELTTKSEEIPEQPQDEDGEETVVPAKKAKKEDKPARDLKKDDKKEDEDEEDDDEDAEHDAENEGEDEEEDDDEEDIEDDDDDDEEDGGSSETGEDDDEDNEDDEDDDENEEDDDEEGEGDDGDESD
ncbi:ribosomal L1 domain-containing protein CG13096 [Teleopsis dalmanni]|uniref:ribosomal L1 domain-containing protein CG13096 n=1 Tax=Teleopsis dalmanni TaxID=139649 RepID=UPI000D32A33B|nr:ribosomal L1 domain-containing protein CG13096 [Teleopsis dalmanni]